MEEHYQILKYVTINGSNTVGEIPKKNKNDTTTLYIANRALDDLKKFRGYLKYCQIVDLAFIMNKIKTKYNALAQSKLESLSFSTALLAIY